MLSTSMRAAFRIIMLNEKNHQVNQIMFRNILVRKIGSVYNDEKSYLK
uniref:Uncharacterized protein n=1 Tax=Lepeophtheirus salmonis TaxID=72036 RepID=A0A0K2T308_LEPSM